MADVERWFQELERKAVELEAVAAALVVELARPRERYLVAQLEERGQPTRLWKARVREHRGQLQLGPMKPDTQGVSTMTVLPPDPSAVN